jgi:pyruvate dehydrogenase E2 component (dihydrolipoamide acetyltransferase)
MSQIEIKVPDIGDAKDVEVIEILVAAGDTIEAEQSLITLESDKSSMEIPASQGGVIKSINVKLGQKVSEGALILTLEASAARNAKDQPATAVQDERAAAFTGSTDKVVADEPEKQAADGPTAGGQESDGVGRRAGGTVTIDVPDIGDFAEVEVIEVLVAEGDRIHAEQSLITVETDKASMEIPAPTAGTVKSVSVKVGDKVSKGTKLMEVESNAASASGTQPAPQATAAKPAIAVAPATADAAKTDTSQAAAQQTKPAADDQRVAPAQALQDDNLPVNKLPHASPTVRKFARELGANLSRIKGSGLKERITADDVRAYVKQALAVAQSGLPAAAGGGDGAALGLLPWPKVDFAKFGEIETKPLARIKKISGANLHRNWVMIPHVTNNDVVDITELEALRVTLNKENEKSGVKVTMLAFLIKAVVAALKKFPEFNASLDGDNLIYKHYYHVGFAADTPNGLVVPVIRDADKKGILELAQDSSALAKKARDGKLAPADMQGGCFSISSLGGIGGTSFTPIINAPEVAILGVSRSSHQPVWDGKQFVPRLQLPLSLSYDHRVIDGAAAARFNAYLGTLLADFRRIAL